MTKRKWLFGVALLALIGIVVLGRGYWSANGEAARPKGPPPRVVPVEVAKAEPRLSITKSGLPHDTTVVLLEYRG